ncbi:MAG: hypothetical protein ACO22A_01015 [Schleiferiaceae bacterium]
MENTRGDRVTRRYVGLFSVYAGDRPSALFSSLWTMLRYQSRPLDRAVGVIEGELTTELELVVAHFTNEVEWIRIPRVQNRLSFGLPTALNAGLTAISSEDVVLKIDTDDLYPPCRVALTLEAFEAQPALGIFGGQVDEWDEHFAVFKGSRSVPLAHQEIFRYGKKRNPFNGPTVAFTAGLARELGGFAHVGANEDYVLWASILQSGAYAQNSPEVLAYMRGGTDLVARRSTVRTRKVELEALRAIRKLGYFNAPTYILHVLVMQLVRRMPLQLNLYLYQRLRQGGTRPIPRVVAHAAQALTEWQP